MAITVRKTCWVAHRRSMNSISRLRHGIYLGIRAYICTTTNGGRASAPADQVGAMGGGGRGVDRLSHLFGAPNDLSYRARHVMTSLIIHTQSTPRRRQRGSAAAAIGYFNRRDHRYGSTVDHPRRISVYARGRRSIDRISLSRRNLRRSTPSSEPCPAPRMR